MSMGNCFSLIFSEVYQYDIVDEQVPTTPELNANDKLLEKTTCTYESTDS